MKPNQTIQERINSTSVRVGKLLIPANSLLEHLRGFVEPAAFHSEGFDEFHMSISGSLTAVTLQGRQFALTSGHQLSKRGYEYPELCVIDYGRRRLVTSERVVFPDGDGLVNDDWDCRLFEFTAPVASGRLRDKRWYDIELEHSRDKTPEPIAAIAIGYPAASNSIDYNQFIYEASPYAALGSQSKPDIRGRLALSLDSPLETSPSGMSGGAVFGIKLQTSGELSVFLAGLITEASQQKVHFISLVKLKALFKRLI